MGRRKNVVEPAGDDELELNFPVEEGEDWAEVHRSDSLGGVTGRGKGERQDDEQAIDGRRVVDSRSKTQIAIGGKREEPDRDRRDCSGLRGTFDAPVHCSGCPKHPAASLEKQAIQVIREASAIFAKEEKVDRAEAFQGWVSRLVQGSDVIVESRVLALDRMVNMVKEIHSMIGAPKKQTEEGQRAPMDLMAEWLNEAI